jgi:hypothetical protein
MTATFTVPSEVVDEVVGTEPYRPTVDRLRENLERNCVAGGVLGIALGSESSEVDLGVEPTGVGTQTPAVGTDYGEAWLCPGDQPIREHGTTVGRKSKRELFCPTCTNPREEFEVSL